MEPHFGDRMEPDVETSPRAARDRSTNPEVYENVPGHVIPILEREFDDFDTEADKFIARRDSPRTSSSASGSSRASTASARRTSR